MTQVYRPDVDGLRAIAVLSVVAYHFDLPGLTAGYLGVDVFFVLSGYLITRIIWTEAQAQDFNLGRFYERRIRRILPALLVVLIATTMVAFVILLPSDLVGYGKSLLATLTFVANIYFWRDTNYFAAAADLKPLLHMWSLGVEEQFYILFPLILVLLTRYAPRAVVWVLASLVLLSLVGNVAVNMTGMRSTAFYILPTRAWELGIGAVVAVLPSRVVPGLRIAPSVALVGLGALLVGIFLGGFWSGPIPAAVLAVVGTALVIWAGTVGATPASRILSLRPVLFFGRISYSLYLWHWPIVVLSTYWLVRDLTFLEKVALFAIMVGVATLSLRFVENPARSQDLPFRRLGVWIGAVTALLAVAALCLIVMRGLPGRLPDDAAQINASVGTNYRCALSEMFPFGGSRACRLHLPSGDLADATIVLYGNSHAQMYAPIFRDIGTETGHPTILVPMNACLPTPSVNINAGCAALAARNLDAILTLSKVDRVVIAFNWDIESRGLIEASGRPVEFAMGLSAGLNDLLDRIEAVGKTPVLIGPIPVPGYDIASELSRAMAFDRPVTIRLEEPLGKFEERHAAVSGLLAAQMGERFLEPHLALCDDQKCRWVIEGRSVFSDSNHIAQAELPRFRPYLEKALPR